MPAKAVTSFDKEKRKADWVNNACLPAIFFGRKRLII
jgi:hypothetical protein